MTSVATPVKTEIMHEKALTQSPFRNIDYQWMEKVQNCFNAVVQRVTCSQGLINQGKN